MREQIRVLIQELINQCTERLNNVEGEINDMLEEFEQRFLYNEIQEGETLIIPADLIAKQTKLHALLHEIHTRRENYVNRMNQILLDEHVNRTAVLRGLLDELHLDYQNLQNRIQEI